MKIKSPLFFVVIVVKLFSFVGSLAPPMGLRAYAISPNSFRIKWLENYRNPKRSTLYTLRYRKISDDEPFQYLNTTTGEVKRLNVITSNESYEFSVKALRGRKESNWSEPVETSLENTISINPPRGLKVKGSTSTEIKLKWRRPKGMKHLISGYRVTYKLSGAKISIVKQTSTRTLLISNLKPSSTYIIKVQTTAKDGQLSEPAKISFRTKRKLVVRAPTNFTVEVYGSTKLLVQWSPPKGKDINQITGYQIQYRQKGVQKGTLCTVVTTKKKQKYIITDLYKGQEYKVRIAAKSGHLTGKATNWAVAKLHGGKNIKDKNKDKNKYGKEKEDKNKDEEEEENVDKTSLNDIISIAVNHTDFTYKGQNVTLTCVVHYQGEGQRSVLWTKGDDLKVERIGAWFIDISGRHTFEESVEVGENITVLVSQLTLRKIRTKDSGSYTCHVLNTDDYASVNLTVTDASPGPPENIEAEVLSHDSIGVYWSPPTNTANFPVTYEVYCWRTRQQREWDYKDFVAKDIVDTQFVITELKYDTQYYIGVVAVNQFGRSNFSLVDNVTVSTSDLKPLEITEIRIINPVIFPHSTDESIHHVGQKLPTPSPSQTIEKGLDPRKFQGTAVNISWDTSVINTWPLKRTQHIIHYKTDNSTVHQKSVWQNYSVIYNLEDDRIYYFQIETVFPGKSIFSSWRKLSTYLTEVTAPPPPRDVFLNILSSNTLRISWFPPPEEYRVRVRTYRLAVLQEDGVEQVFEVDRKTLEFIIEIQDRSKRLTVEVTAVNNVGTSDKVVRILEPFSNIANGIHLSARALTSTSAKVSWSSSASADLTRFLLRYQPIHSNVSQPIDVFLKPTETEYVIKDLQHYTEYSIYLIPYYNDLPGNLTSVTVLTYSDVPSAPPKDVTVKNVNVSNFLVSWKPPPAYTQNGEMLYYSVEYRTMYDPISKSMLVPADKTELLLSGLKEDVVYELRVGAVTINGTGPLSSWVQMVVPKSGLAVITQSPEPPTNLTAEPIPHGINLMWASPHNTSIPVKGYIVGHGRFLPEVYRIILGPTDHQYTLTGLRPEAQYLVSVRTFNVYGESKAVILTAKTGASPKGNEEPTTEKVTTTTTTPVPGAPYDITIQELGEEVPTALVRWSRPNIADQIKGYILLYTNDSSLPLYEWTGVFERTLQYVIKNLAFNTTYFVRIQSQLADGTGAMSKIKFFTTRSVVRIKDILPMPSILSAFSGPDYIQINWKPPDYAHIIRGYTLGYGVKQAGEYQEMLPFSETSFKIQRLAPETLYHISLRSFGEFGESERAVISVSTTA